MTQLFRSPKQIEDLGKTSPYLLQRLRDELENQPPEKAHQSLFEAYTDLYKVVMQLMDENQEMWEIIRNKQQIEHEMLENYDLSKDQVNEMILKEIKIGQVFYPSDIADKFGLDLKTVIEVIDGLKREGKFVVKSDHNVST